MVSPSDLVVDTPEELAEAIGTERFRIPSAPYPFCEVWFQVDYIEDGKIVLKFAEQQT